VGAELNAPAWSPASLWGNGWDGTDVTYPKIRSALCMFVFDTDSPWLAIQWDQLTSLYPYADYMAMAVYRGGTTKPGTLVAFVDPQNVPVGAQQTDRITLGGSGTQRIWIVGSASNALAEAMPSGFWVAPGSTVTRVTESGASVGVEGWGGLNTASDLGYLDDGTGHLTGGGYATLRAAHVARLAYMNPSAIVYVTPATNRITQQPTAGYLTFEIGQMVDAGIALVGASRVFYISCLRRTDMDATSWRAEEAAAIAARPGVSYLTGLTLGAQAFADADLSSDGVHPNDAGHVKGCAATMTLLSGITGRVCLVGNSIVCGAGNYIGGGAYIYAARDGWAALVRAAR
jgi:hypothetical protein